MIENGWVDWAVKRPGPATKVYAQANAVSGIVCHSSEGWLAGAVGELDKPDRQASWHFTTGLDGSLYQHYPVTASCWASGNMEANTRYVAIESEGVAGTPLNEAQVGTFLRLCDELGFHTRGADVFEHNEVATRWSPNGGGTACPSHRYDPAFALLEGYMDRVSRLERILIGNGFQAVCRPGTEDLFPAGTAVTPEGQDGPRYMLTGEAALAYADRRGFSLALAIEANTDADVARTGGAR